MSTSTPPTTSPEATPETPETAAAAAAAAHFAARLRFETDAADLLADLTAGRSGLVVVDTRSPEAYAVGHIPGAVNLLTGKLSERRTAHLDRDATYVTYCAGPHCNGSTKSALRLSELGFTARELIGGWWGWLENGSPVEAG